MTPICEGSIVRIRVRVGTKTGRRGVVPRVYPQSGGVLVARGTGTLRKHLSRVLSCAVHPVPGQNPPPHVWSTHPQP